jgi:hypothetical protein
VDPVDALRVEFDETCEILKDLEYRHRQMLFAAAVDDVRAAQGTGQAAPMRDLELALEIATECERRRVQLRTIVDKVNTLGKAVGKQE